MTPSQKHITEEMCHVKHRWLTWSIGIVYTMLGLIIAMIGWCLFVSSSASARADESWHMSKTESEKSEERQKAIQKSLDNLLTEQRRISDRLNSYFNP